MLRSVKRPREFLCLHYGDGNCNNLTTKLTDPILRKRMCSQRSSADGLDSSIYNKLTTTWKKASETGLQTFPTRRPCTPTSTIKFMTFCTISSAHPADASDMIDRTSLSSLFSTSDFHV